MSGRIVVVNDLLEPVFTVNATSGTRILSTIESTSTASGALVVYGGVGIAKNLYVGGTINSTSISSGSIHTQTLTASSIFINTQLFTGLASITNLVSGNASIGTLQVSSGVNAPSATISNLVATTASIANVAITGAINVPTATIQSLFTQVGSASTLIVGNNATVGTLFVTSSLQLNSVTASNLAVTNDVSAQSATVTNLVATNMSATNLVGTSSTVADLNVTSSSTIGALVSSTVNANLCTVVNLIGTSMTSGTLLVFGTINSANTSTGNFFSNSGTITALVSSSITTGSLVVTGSLGAASSTITNLAASSFSTASLNAPSGVTASSLFATSINTALGTISNLFSSNATISNIVSATCTLGNTRVSPGSDIRIGYNNGNSQLILRNSANAACLEFGVLPNDDTLVRNSTSGGSVYINTVGGSVRFGNGTSTSGTTMIIASPLAGDTVGTSGAVTIVGELTVNSVLVVPNPGDIRKELSFSAANNQSVNANVTNLRFLESTTRSFLAYCSVTIIATTNLYAQFELRGLQKDTGVWVISAEHVGDITGVEFSITSSGGFGQVQYTSTDNPGFVSATLVFSAVTNKV